MKIDYTSLIQKLRNIGFTELEALIYLSLINHGGDNSGYSISKMINKPVSNVYKALNTLQKKGAIIYSDHLKVRHYIAVPIDEFVAYLELKRKNEYDDIIQYIQNISVPQNSELLYHIDSIEQAFVLAKSIINNCKKVLLIDCSYNLLEELRSEIEKALARNCKIFIKTTHRWNIDDIEYLIPAMDSPRLSNTPYRWIEVSSDSNHYITINFDKEISKVSTGIYCKGERLAHTFHSGLAHEMIVTKLSEYIKNSSDKDISDLFRQLTHSLLWEAGTIDAFERKFQI